MEECKEKSVLETMFADLKLEDIMNSAIINSMNQEVKDKMIGSIMSYLNSQTDGYGSNRKTIIEDMFYTALRTPLAEQMRKTIDNTPEIMTEIERCVKEATTKFILMDKESLITSLTSTMHRAFEEKY